MSRDLAVLVGNGLSIAFNSDLQLPRITQEMLGRIEGMSDNGSETVRAMKQVASRALPAGASTDEDFEILVGAFGAEDRAIRYLVQLAGLVAPEDDDLVSALERVSKFSVELRDLGISHVLEIIFERSRADHELAQELHRLTRNVANSFDGRIAFGNLNYDALLLSALIETCGAELADMGHGVRRVRITVDDAVHEVPALRRSASEFPPDRRVQLLQLHGSLTFWANQENDVFAKIDTDFLRAHSFWEAMRNGEVRVRPVVVLANQQEKPDHVREFPFSLAYEMFDSRLRSANHWVVIGYSFRDSCVNDRLRTIFSDRPETERPKVLVVTLGPTPTVHEVERALGWAADDGDSSEWLTIFRNGAAALSTSPTWTSFAE